VVVAVLRQGLLLLEIVVVLAAERQVVEVVREQPEVQVQPIKEMQVGVLVHMLLSPEEVVEPVVSVMIHTQEEVEMGV
jgi:hypothetical protein